MGKTINIPEDVMLNAKDFMQLLKDQGMVIGPRTVFESNLVDGLPFEEFRARILRKKLLSFLEISKAQLWGNIGKKAAYQIGKKQLPDSDFVMVNGKIKIPLESVKSIAASRGYQI